MDTLIFKGLFLSGEFQRGERCLFLRIKVRILCKQCGETYILRGIKEQGVIQTGFKQCLCSNSSGFEIEERA
ncbi:hypothetical protein BSK52_15505 [Paenibacillus odorifer]|uniref:Uncharacterized protein n=1 Tax=Paenibacillus odorifer TaxID=189426 RepID=A0A1R0XXK2_9BACL|nr:hypothetical protein BSK52_15505 [Paenibacillus odorifer]